MRVARLLGFITASLFVGIMMLVLPEKAVHQIGPILMSATFLLAFIGSVFLIRTVTAVIDCHRTAENTSDRLSVLSDELDHFIKFTLKWTSYMWMLTSVICSITDVNLSAPEIGAMLITIAYAIVIIRIIVVAFGPVRRHVMSCIAGSNTRHDKKKEKQEVKNLLLDLLPENWTLSTLAKKSNIQLHHLHAAMNSGEFTSEQIRGLEGALSLDDGYIVEHSNNVTIVNEDEEEQSSS